MSAGLIDGKASAARVLAEVSAGAAEFVTQRGRAPALHLVLVGDDADSLRHVQGKVRSCEKVGLRGELHQLPGDTAQAALLALIEQLNRAPDVDGILVQLPLPASIDASAVLQAVHPAKDVDGLTAHNVGQLALGRPGLVPCTPAGVLRLLDDAQVPIASQRALVIGRSALVGRPIAALLLARDATVCVAHSHSRDLAGLVAQADLLVSATGQPGLIRGSWIKQGAVVIDVGQTRGSDGKLHGDVEADAAQERASLITPVTGGVGPMTVAMLLANTLQAALARTA